MRPQAIRVYSASTQVNLPVFTGKLHAEQVNCVWGLFTCELQVKLPAFAGNFAPPVLQCYVKTRLSVKKHRSMRFVDPDIASLSY